MGTARRFTWPALTVTVVLALGAPGALATAHKSPVPFKAGEYSGEILQPAPHVYTGKITFAVHNMTITHLAFTVQAQCRTGVLGPIWVTDFDPVPNFHAKVSRTGAFFYSGKVAGRQLRLKGSLRSGTARGTFFQTFPLGSGLCSMVKPAPFRATH